MDYPGFSDTYGADLTYPSYSSEPAKASEPSMYSAAKPSTPSSSSMSTSSVVMIICLVAVFAVALSGLIIAALAYTRVPSEPFSAVERGQLAALAAQASSLTALNDAITLQAVGSETWIQAQGFTDGSATAASGGQRFTASDGKIEGSTFTAGGNLTGDGVFTGVKLVLSGTITVDDTSDAQNVFINDGAMTITSNGAQSAIYGHTNITMGDSDTKVSTIITNSGITIDKCPVSRLVAINSGTFTAVSVVSLTNITALTMSSAIGLGTTVDISTLEVGSVIVVEGAGDSKIDAKLLTLTVAHNNGGAIGTWPTIGGVDIDTPSNGALAQLNWTFRAVLRVTALTSSTITFQPSGIVSVGESASSQFSPFTGSLITISSSTITFVITALVGTSGTVGTTLFKITREA